MEVMAEVKGEAEAGIVISIVDGLQKLAILC